MDLPESFLSKVKSSGSPPMNTPVVSPIMVLPLEADALPDDEGQKKVWNNILVSANMKPEHSGKQKGTHLNKGMEDIRWSVTGLFVNSG